MHFEFLIVISHEFILRGGLIMKRKIFATLFSLTLLLTAVLPFGVSARANVIKPNAEICPNCAVGVILTTTTPWSEWELSGVYDCTCPDGFPGDHDLSYKRTCVRTKHCNHCGLEVNVTVVYDFMTVHVPA